MGLIGNYLGGAQLSRQELLEIIPVRHPEAKLVEESTGRLLLLLPAPDRFFYRWIKVVGKPRQFEIDALGRSVWDMVDGHRRVQKIVTRFAEHNKINIREAELGVMSFLTTLRQRNLVLFATDDTAVVQATKKSGKKS